MGQYWVPIILKENWESKEQPIKASLKSYDYGSGSKLMEHSYVANRLVNAVMRMIDLYDKHGDGVTFAWVGDYADPKSTEAHPRIVADDGQVVEEGIDLYGEAHLFVGDYECNTTEYTELKEKLLNSDLYHYRYIINRTRGEYVVIPKDEKDKWIIHPLPILTADGNNRGGGDYDENGINGKLVGTWAYDNISVSNDPDDCKNLKQVDWKTESE